MYAIEGVYRRLVLTALATAIKQESLIDTGGEGGQGNGQVLKATSCTSPLLSPHLVKDGWDCLIQN
ncbi:hypothetical protein [Scytonema sp. PRP1]|uniref:hypothetical protein n=1 Tax=Scytonema sp. PRP1 TaxID=3120513 RepID=UPI002FD0F53D